MKIIDAVNAAHGEWMTPPIWAPKAKMFYIRYDTGLDAGDWVFCNHIPEEGYYFTRKQFDDCVEECSTNLGKPTKKEGATVEPIGYPLADGSMSTDYMVGDKVRHGDFFSSKSSLSASDFANKNICWSKLIPTKGTLLKVAKRKAALLPKPKPLSGFINLFYGKNCNEVYLTKQQANDAVMPTSPRAACIDLSQHNEGEGL